MIKNGGWRATLELDVVRSRKRASECIRSSACRSLSLQRAASPVSHPKTVAWPKGRPKAKAKAGDARQSIKDGLPSYPPSSDLSPASPLDLSSLPPSKVKSPIKGIQWSTQLVGLMAPGRKSKPIHFSTPHFRISASLTSELPESKPSAVGWSSESFIKSSEYQSQPESRIEWTKRLLQKNEEKANDKVPVVIVATKNAVSRMAVERNRVRTRLKAAIRLVVTRQPPPQIELTPNQKTKKLVSGEEDQGSGWLLPTHSYCFTPLKTVYNLPMPMLIESVKLGLSEVLKRSRQKGREPEVDNKGVGLKQVSNPKLPSIKTTSKQQEAASLRKGLGAIRKTPGRPKATAATASRIGISDSKSKGGVGVQFDGKPGKKRIY